MTEKPNRGRRRKSPVETFELSMLGGATERRFRRLRPELERIKWGSLAAARIPDEMIGEAREVWTRVAYIEYRSAAAMTAVAELLIAAKAPLNLSAIASRFAFDELCHAEMCSRVLGELGGAIQWLHPSDDLIWERPPVQLPPLTRAADLVVSVFCVAEAFALPMAQVAARQNAKQPLVGEVMSRIARDEADHASFGWIFFDWATPFLDQAAREHIHRAASLALREYESSISDLSHDSGPTLGWLSDRDFRLHAERALEQDVRRPLRLRGLWNG